MSKPKVPVIDKSIELGSSVHIPVLGASDKPKVHKKAHHQATLILVCVAALPPTFQLSRTSLLARTSLSCRDLTRGLQYLVAHNYAKVIATTGADGRMAGKTYCFSFAGAADKFPAVISSWTAEHDGTSSGTRNKSYTAKPCYTDAVALGDASPTPPYNVALVEGREYPQPPAEAGGFDPILPGEVESSSLPAEIEEILQRSVASLPEEVSKPAVLTSARAYLTAWPEVQQNVLEDDGLFPSEQERDNFVDMHTRYGFSNPFGVMPDLALGRQGSLLAFLRGDATKFEFRRWMTSKGPVFTPRQAFYEPVEKLTRLPRLRSGGASEFMHDTLCGLILQDSVAGDLPYSEVRSILRGLRRGFLRPQQVLRAWLHTRLTRRVDPLQLRSLLATCAMTASEGDSFALRTGLRRWEMSRAADIAALRTAVTAKVSSTADMGETLKGLSREQAAVAWLMSVSDDCGELGSALRAGFKAAGADPTFMAMELLQFDTVFGSSFLCEAPRDEAGVADHSVVVNHAVYRARRWVVELGRIMQPLLVEDIASFDKAHLNEAQLYGL